MPDFEIDNLTLLLLLAVAGLLVYDRISRPAPLVHPLLLGKQSEVSPIRKENESGVYRSFATGHGTPLIVRPASSLKTVRDVIAAPKGLLTQRIILDTPLTDAALSELVRLLPLGLHTLFPTLSADHVQPTPILVLLPSSPRTSLPLLLLSLASSPSNPLIVLPESRFLIPALSNSAHPSPGLVVVHESLAEGVVEQVMESGNTCGVLVVGDCGGLGGLVSSAKSHGMVVRFWEDVWEAGEKASLGEMPGPQPSDIHSYYYSSDDTGHSATAFTHLNFTAGIAGFLSAFPADKRPNAAKKDVVASAEPLTTPFGMTVALASIWSGTGFSLIGPESVDWAPKMRDSPGAELESLAASPSRPSILVLNKEQHSAIVQAAHTRFRLSSLASFAFSSRVSEVQGGHVSRSGFWDEWVWKGIREASMGGLAGDKLRTLIVTGESPSLSTLAWSNVLLGLPTARMTSHPLSTGPILSSHFYDLQFPSAYLASAPSTDGPPAHTGAPTINTEILLRDVCAESGEKGTREGTAAAYGAEEPIRGTLYVRGPALGTSIGPMPQPEDGWVKGSAAAAVQTNGTFAIATRS